MKQGQMAFEFLSTYGWAFIVIVVMITTLTYFGVLKPSRLLPDRCNFGPEVECIDAQISYTDDSVKVRLGNNMGEVLTITSMTLSTELTTLSCTPDLSGAWGSGVRNFIFNGCELESVGFLIGEKGKLFVKINYYLVKSGPEYAHTMEGEIFTTVV